MCIVRILDLGCPAMSAAIAILMAAIGVLVPIASVSAAVGDAPVLTSAASRKVHGPAGTFDLALSLTLSTPTTAFFSEVGSSDVAFQFDSINVTVGPNIPDGDPQTVTVRKSGVLQPGTYNLRLSAQSESVFGRSVGLHTQWGFRLDMEPVQ